MQIGAMKPKLSTTDHELWKRVTATVIPLRSAHSLAFESDQSPDLETSFKPKAIAPMLVEDVKSLIVRPSPSVSIEGFNPDPIEPNRKRRIARERDPIEAVLDLHGLTAQAAEGRVKSFVEQAFANDFRAIMIITGKGMGLTGVLRRETPNWLADPKLAGMVAGLSFAHPRHGGTGALYVALKRRRS